MQCVMLINTVQTVNISYTRQENFSKGKIPRHVQNVCITEKKKPQPTTTTTTK